jgi:hypothetical protein
MAHQYRHATNNTATSTAEAKNTPEPPAPATDAPALTGTTGGSGTCAGPAGRDSTRVPPNRATTRATATSPRAPTTSSEPSTTGCATTCPTRLLSR